MVDEYIRREDALRALYEDYAYPAMDIIKGVPAADVAEVVRCRDCIYNIDGLCFCRRPLGNGVAVEPDDFCSWGETE